MDDMRNGPSQNVIKRFIQQQVDNNMTWQNIKNMLRLDKEFLMNLLDEDNIDAIPISLNVKYEGVYYEMKKSLEKKARLHAKLEQSLSLWEKKIIENEHCRGFFFSRNLDSIESGMFCISFMCEWQLKVY
jgi:hypothetical protein